MISCVSKVEMDTARHRLAFVAANIHSEASDVTGYTLAPDSDDTDAGARPSEIVDSNDDTGLSVPTSPLMPDPTARRLRDRFANIMLTDIGTSAALESLPLIVHPTCVEPGCSVYGNMGMLACSMCDGSLHRNCGAQLGDDEEEDDSERRCSACASNKGERKRR